jgi:hypothetical protein
MTMPFGIGLWPFVIGAIGFSGAFLFALVFAVLLAGNKIMDEVDELRLQRGHK